VSYFDYRINSVVDLYRDAVECRTKLAATNGATPGEQAYAEGVEAQCRQNLVDFIRSAHITAEVMRPVPGEPACTNCGDRLLPSSRFSGNVMCGPCSRGEGFF
jgi:hypothetical protein